MKKIRGILKAPKQAPVVHEIPKGLKGLQETVGGNIEAPYLAELNDAGITAWINEDGKLNGMEPNFLIYDNQDCIMGPVFFTGHNDEGETISLTPAQEKIVQRFLATAPVYLT